MPNVAEQMPETATRTILRVLLEPRENDQNIWVATCLENGYVCTGLGYDEARDNILDLLRTEVIYANENGRKLGTRAQVPPVLEQKWKIATSEHPPTTQPLFPPEKKPVGRVTSSDRQVAVARAVR
jgi:hypothetical protein